MRILAIGAGAGQIAQQYENPEIEVAPLVASKKQKKEPFDVVVSYLTLQTVSLREGQSVLNDWAACLKQGGEFVLFVPSLEWAAEQILSPKPSPATLIHLYGPQNKQTNFYVSGYTMNMLRNMCETAGINITHARSGEYMINEEICEMHLVRGTRR